MMKLILAALMLSSTAFASDVLLVCKSNQFNDLNEIIISEGAQPEQIVVTEIANNGLSHSSINNVREFLDSKIKLSSWNGYSRVLFFDGKAWNISFRDECSGGIVTVDCQ
jgi:hypothetical protein